MECRYCKDEFCVNDQSPMRADYCPVPDIPGVCQHEDRKEVEAEMANEKRLIDANELIDRLNHTTMVAYPNLFPGLLSAVEVVEDSPTVDAVEVVHGHWIDRPSMKGQVYCSECATIEKSTDSNYKSKRCPNCGAKMDLEVK